MKTAFEAKIVIETDVYGDFGEANEINMKKIIDHINSKNIEINTTNNWLSNKVEPVITIILK